MTLFNERFVVITIVMMFLSVVIVKLLSKLLETKAKETKQQFDDKIADLCKNYAPLIFSGILLFIFMPDKYDWKDVFFLSIYFIGGIYAIYKWLFKPVLNTIKKIIEKKGL
jgi:hypothetical protein